MQRNSIIAEVFHRAGLIEKWGRGTNRVAEITGAAVVTFRVPVAARRAALPESRLKSSGEVTEVVTSEVTGEVTRLLAAMTGEMKRQEMWTALGLKAEAYFQEAYLLPALAAGLIEMTLPDKPTSRLQRYRLTGKGRDWLASSRGS